MIQSPIPTNRRNKRLNIHGEFCEGSLNRIKWFTVNFENVNHVENQRKQIFTTLIILLINNKLLMIIN